MLDIFCDMDGVIADFDGRLVDYGVPYGHSWNMKDEELWPLVKSIPHFWRDLEWKEGGEKLWKFIAPHSPSILTAPSRMDRERAKKEKREWVEKKIGTHVPIIFERAKWKANYATSPTSIIIDDLKTTVDSWKENGGIGILHRDADETIAQLKEIMDGLGV